MATVAGCEALGVPAFQVPANVLYTPSFTASGWAYLASAVANTGLPREMSGFGKAPRATGGMGGGKTCGTTGLGAGSAMGPGPEGGALLHATTKVASTP